MKQSNSWLSGLWRAADMASRSASPASADDERHAVVSNPPSPTQLTGLGRGSQEPSTPAFRPDRGSRGRRRRTSDARRVVEPETDEEYTASQRTGEGDCPSRGRARPRVIRAGPPRDLQGGKFALKSVAVASLTTPKKREHAPFRRVALALLRGHPNILRMHAAWTAPGALTSRRSAPGAANSSDTYEENALLPQETRFIIALELAAALSHAHKHKVAYRDVKPENVLFGGTGHVLLADFGLSKIVQIDDKDFSTKELHFILRHAGVHGAGGPGPGAVRRKSVDWWALGMLSAELLTGLPPWYTEDRVELFRRIRRRPWSRGTWSVGIRGLGGTLCNATPLCSWRDCCDGTLYNDPSDADIKNDRYFAFCGGLEDLPTMEPPFNPSSSRRGPRPAFHDRVANERAPSRRRCAPLSEVAAVARNFEASDSVSMTADAVALDVAAAAGAAASTGRGARIASACRRRGCGSLWLDDIPASCFVVSWACRSPLRRAWAAAGRLGVSRRRRIGWPPRLQGARRRLSPRLMRCVFLPRAKSEAHYCRVSSGALAVASARFVFRHNPI